MAWYVVIQRMHLFGFEFWLFCSALNA